VILAADVTSHTIGYRLFRIGRMPASIRREILGETVLFEAEGIRVRIHQSGRVPGAIIKRGVTLLSGSVAITEARVIGTGRHGKLADVPFDIDADGPAAMTLAEDGVHVHFDLDRVHPSCHGEMRMDFHADIPPEALAQLPWLEKSFPVSPQAVVRMFGSRRKLPAPTGA
jgi:hypothetical protein